MATKIRILSAVCLGNGVDAYEGEVHTVPDSQATALIYNQTAEAYVEPPEPPAKETKKGSNA